MPEQVKAVVYPVAPLFDMDANAGAGALRPLCIKALKRIFHMCDRDKVPTPLPAAAALSRNKKWLLCDVMRQPGVCLICVAIRSMAIQLASSSCATCQRGWTELPQ